MASRVLQAIDEMIGATEEFLADDADDAEEVERRQADLDALLLVRDLWVTAYEDAEIANQPEGEPQ